MLSSGAQRGSARRKAARYGGLLAALGLMALVVEWRSVAEAVESPASVPAGTVLPVRLTDAIAVKEVQPGQAIEGEIAQEVPLANRQKIPARSKLTGSIVSVGMSSDGTAFKVTLRFTQLEQRRSTLTIVAYLRAIASFAAVRQAQTPLSGANTGSPSGWVDTVQIGGDIRFGDGGEVRGRGKQKVGKGVRGGVLVLVRPNLERGCEGAVNGENLPQALWVFSSDACGVYDLPGVKISHTGRGAPRGEITLEFEKESGKLEAGTGMLLRIAPQS